jgi:hypothetical protein
MSPLLASHDSTVHPGHSQIQLVVQIYVLTYLAFVLIGFACLGIRWLLDSKLKDGSEGDDDFPPDDYWRDSGRIGPRPPLARKNHTSNPRDL